ncbi:ATP-binding protein [Lachnospiraceae bacterium ZAX-1]
MPIVSKAAQSEKNLKFSADQATNIFAERVLYYALLRLGVTLTVDSQGSYDSIAVANSGETDGHFLQSPGMEEQYPNLVMISEQICTVNMTMYVKAGNNVRIQNWSDLKGLKVGMMYQMPYIEQHVQDTALSVQKYKRISDSYEALKKGKIDVMINPVIAGRVIYTPNYVEKAGAISSDAGYAYVNKKYGYLAKRIAESIKKMKSDGTYEQLLKEETLPGKTKEETLPGKTKEETLQGKTQKKILYISSYVAEMEWEKNLYNGFKQSFRNGIGDLDIHTIHLNALRHHEDTTYNRALANMLREEIMTKAPDVILVSDNEALEFLKDIYHIYFHNTPVVFSGINQYDTEVINGFETVMSGIGEAISAKETVDLILKLFPDTNHLYILNDSKLLGVGARQEIESQLKGFVETGKLTVEFSQDASFEEIKNTIQHFDEGTVVLSGIYPIESMVQNQGFTHDQGKTKYDIFDELSIPIFTLVLTDLGYGQIGGKVTDPNRQGELAQTIVAQVLQGLDVSKIEAKGGSSEDNTWYFDGEQLKKWGISNDDLPKGLKLINHEDSFLEENPVIASIAMILLFAVVTAILVLYLLSRQLRKKNKILKETKKNLHDAEERLQKDKIIADVKSQHNELIAVAPIVLWVSVQDHVVDASSYTKESLGIEKGSLCSSVYESVTVREALLEKLSIFGPLQGELINLRLKTGEYHRFYSNLSYVHYEGEKAIVVCGLDIEENQRQHELLAHAQDDLQQLIDALPVSVMILTRTLPHYPIYVNKAFLELLGFDTIEGTLNYSIAAISPELQPDGEKSIFKMEENIKELLFINGNATFEWQFLRKDGELLNTKVVGNEIVFSGDKTLCIVIQDITAEKKQEEILRQTAEHEREANEIKSKFVRNMSHEIKAPMNVILDLSKMALMKKYEEEAVASFKKINTSAKNLLAIVHDIWDFSKIESKTFDFIYNDFLLEEVLDNAMLIGAQRLDKKPVEMLLNVDLDLPQYIYGDKARLWQILKNILDNSAKFTDKGQISLSACLSDSNEKVDTIKFTIKDTGIGMTQGQIKTLDVPLLQSRQNVKDLTNGTALGLAVTKQLTQLMHGKIEIKSEMLRGTETIITIPFGHAGLTTTIKERCADKRLSGYEILVVEKNQIYHNIITDLLQENGANPLCVYTKEDALAIMKQKPFDILLLDYETCGINGLKKENHEACGDDHLEEEHHKISRIQFLLVQAITNQRLYEQIKGSAYTGVIEKPFGPSSFLQPIYSALNMQQPI